MKAEKINELIWWAEGKDINPESDIDSMFMYRECSDNILNGELTFDIVDDKYDGEYIICSYYVNIKDKQGFSAVVNRDCIWGFETPEQFAKYMAELYDRAMKIQDYFIS